jgi:hypothetical protein
MVALCDLGVFFAICAVKVFDRGGREDKREVRREGR